MLWSSGVACLTGDPIVFLRVPLVMFLLAICVDRLLLFMSGVACLTSILILNNLWTNYSTTSNLTILVVLQHGGTRCGLPDR